MNNPWELLLGREPAVDVKSLEVFVSLLIKWNAAVRLIGPMEEEGAAVQVVDSLLPFYYAKPTFPLLDIGSGAGLPAIPLALAYPEARILCVDPRSKRVSFIRHAARELKLPGITCEAARSDELLALRPELAGAFATVTARAVADVKTLLSWAAPYLAPSGQVILGRGGEEIDPPPGWTMASREFYQGPDSVGDRSVAVFSRNPG